MSQHRNFFGLGLLDDEARRSFELPGAKPHYSPDRPGQVEHIALDLRLDIGQKRVQGTCRIRLNPVRDSLRELVLDAVNQQIDAVRIGKQTQKFDYDGDRLTIQLRNATKAGKPFELSIDYQLDHPQRGLYFIGPDAHYPDKPVQVWTQGEDEDSRYWFPCFDYPGQLATSEIQVRIAKPLTVISNGVLKSVLEDGDMRIFHWVQQEVHPTYLMTLAAGEFVEFQDDWKGVPLTYVVQKGRDDQARRTMGKTPRMVALFSQTFGFDYPYPKYAQVCVDDFIFGGMENTSCTLLTDRCLLDERAALDNRNSESLVAHELAHQWFGDLVVIKHWSHAWLKEGMATYSEVLWTDHEYGAAEAAYYRLGQIRNYLDEDANRYRRPIVTHVYREAIELYDRHLYEKGACVYHMLRAELGEELFWRAIRRFVRDNAHRTVETVDLLRAIEQETGRNLLGLFDQYVLRGGHPEFKVSYSWDESAKLAKLTVTQAQSKPDGEGKDLFDLHLSVAFGLLRGKQPEVEQQTVKLRVHEREQSFYFPLAEKPAFVSFDAGSHTLKTVELAYPLPELKAQLVHDPDPLSRIQAAIALAKQGSLEALNALASALKAEPFWGVRVEIAEQLGNLKLDQAVAALLPGLKDEISRVRRATIEALANFRTDKAYKAIRAIAEKGDPSYLVEGAAIAALGKLGSGEIDGESKEKPILKLLKSILKERSSWNETLRASAVLALAQFKSSSAALDLILEQTAAGTPQPLRLAAIRVLGTVATGQEKADVARILDRLQELSRESFFLSQVAVVTALGRMETGRAIALLQSLQGSSPDGRVKRLAEEAVGRVQKALGSDKGLKALREAVDKLQQENQSLRSRLEALEAKTNTKY
jgi:aminopeptidase N